MCERIAATLPALALLLGLAGCADGPHSVRLPGGPTRGTMTHDEAMGARTGLTTLDRVPQDDRRR